MRLHSLALLAAVATAQETGPFGSTACADVHYIVVRASTEPPGQGIIGALAKLSSSAVPGATVEAIDYPAVLSPYNSSSYNGTLALTSRLRAFVDSCSRARIVLLGYSQGAHVIGDVLCGGGGHPALGPASAPIEAAYADKVAAVVQMGDPRFVTGKGFDAGNATMGSIFGRPANISCDNFASRMKSYCDADDLFCASGNSLEVHLGYTKRYNKDAAAFIAEKLKASESAGGNSSMSGGSSSPKMSSAGRVGATSIPWAFAMLAVAFAFAL